MDILYDHNIRLFCSAQGTPFQLFEHIVTRGQSRPHSSSQVYTAPCFLFRLYPAHLWATADKLLLHMLCHDLPSLLDCLS